MACRKQVHLCPTLILPRETDTVGILRAVSRVFAKNLSGIRKTFSGECLTVPQSEHGWGDKRKRPGAMVFQSEPTLGPASLVKLPGVGGENNGII